MQNQRAILAWFGNNIDRFDHQVEVAKQCAANMRKAELEYKQTGKLLPVHREALELKGIAS